MPAVARRRLMAPALELRGICKRFGAVEANRDVSISVARGSIHGIVGENGAGKSTLMSILHGEQRADSGEIRVDGRAVSIASPRDAIALGIGMAHQHFMLVEAMSVLDNVMLGAEGGALLARGRAATRAKLATLAREAGLAIDPDATVASLTVGARQRVAILKALIRDARVLVLDEPTAVLTPGETAELFTLMRRLRDAGCGIVFITHKLAEVLDVTDRVTVMRRGAVVAEFETTRTSADELAEAMVGRRIAPPARARAAAPGREILRARDLTIAGDTGALRVHGASLSLREGEIVGLAGVSGNGQSELLEGLAGMRPLVSGAVELDGETLAPRRLTPRALRALGVAHVPEDRLKHGLVADFPAKESAMLGYHREARYGGALLDGNAIESECEGLMERWDVRPRAPDLATRRFSGGNQQKLILGREIERDPRVLLVGQPTRGVDIGAIEQIHARMLALRDAGKAILLVSGELDEILALSDRVLVMCDGRIAGERRPEETNARELGLLMAGAGDRAA